MITGRGSQRGNKCSESPTFHFEGVHTFHRQLGRGSKAQAGGAGPEPVRAALRPAKATGDLACWLVDLLACWEALRVTLFLFSLLVLCVFGVLNGHFRRPTKPHVVWWTVTPEVSS